MNTYTIEQIKEYLSSQDSLGDIWYNIDKIDEILTKSNSENEPCCNNHNPLEEYHSCPYKEEIHGDIDFKCNCCELCIQECAENI